MYWRQWGNSLLPSVQRRLSSLRYHFGHFRWGSHCTDSFRRSCWRTSGFGCKSLLHCYHTGRSRMRRRGWSGIGPRGHDSHSCNLCWCMHLMCPCHGCNPAEEANNKRAAATRRDVLDTKYSQGHVENEKVRFQSACDHH